MMTTKTLKIACASLLTLAFATGTAVAGDKAGCKDKKTTKATQAAVTITTPTEVLSVAEGEVKRTKVKMKKAYTFDEALELCQKKGADDLQDCIDYKTGKTQMKTEAKT
jgi:hypothetical protein